MNFGTKIVNKINLLTTRKQSFRDCVHKVNNKSLLFYYGNNYSQAGQDGIINEILRRININNGIFVEFGGWDGIHLSNCRSLYERGFKGVFIEANPKKINQCKRNYPLNDICLINEFVGAPSRNVPGKSLKELLDARNIDINNIKVLSIDVDGPDLDIFLDLKFRPPLIILEGGTNYSPYLDKNIKVPQSIANNNNQQPFPYIFDQVIKKGYRIVCFQQDSYIVREDFLYEFELFDHLQLYKDSWYFHTKESRELIKYIRSKNKFIKNLEEKELGIFHKDPITYEIE